MHASAKVFSIPPNPSPQHSQKDPFYRIRVRADGATLCDAKAEEIAELDKQHADIFKKLNTQVSGLQFEAFLRSKDHAIVGTAKKSSRMVLPCEVNLYGPAEDAEWVGARLGEAKIFLQEPCSLPPYIPYYNPHVYSTSKDLRTPFFTKRQLEKDERFDQEINSILCQTHNFELDHKLKQDSRIKSILQP